jgi:hypothetical protein
MSSPWQKVIAALKWGSDLRGEAAVNKQVLFTAVTFPGHGVKQDWYGTSGSHGHSNCYWFLRRPE